MGAKNFQLIPGYHAVREALLSEPLELEELWIGVGKRSDRIHEILKLAERWKMTIRFKRPDELSHLLPQVAHQGIVGVAKPFAYSDFDLILRLGLRAHPHGLLIAADHITDEGNLGALIRSAAFFGAQGLIIPKDRSAAVTARVQKRSSGACAHLPIARVVNMVRALDLLKGEGYWVIGASGESEKSIYRFDWDRDLVLVLGNEERGLSRTVKGRCHQLVGIPSPSSIGSLNVSVAGGVILSEIFRRRAAD